MTHESLAFLWFILLGVLLSGYAVLDGFDLGVGILHPLARGDRERRTMLNSIGPLWDGNEVWLVTFGGALFAAFPVAYATVFSAFYDAFMLLLVCLIFRAVSIEFRSKVHSTRWRAVWDTGFFLSSLVAAFLFGVAAGNVLAGMPIEASPEGAPIYTGTFVGQLRPFPLLSGLLTVTLFAMHGAIYVYLKTEDELQRRARRWMWGTFFAFLAAFLIVTAYAVLFVPKASDQLRTHWWLWFIPALNVLAIANIPRAIYQGRPGDAFLSSCFAIVAFASLFSVEIFPSLIESNVDPAYDITIYNASSSASTLALMALIAAIGLPFVLSYTVTIYWLFRGKVRLDSSSY
jgi:cytochrome d ubiquinol oxidase subunit II